MKNHYGFYDFIQEIDSCYRHSCHQNNEIINLLKKINVGKKTLRYEDVFLKEKTID